MISEPEAFRAMDEMCNESERINAQLRRAMVIPMRRKTDHELRQHFTPEPAKDYRPALLACAISAAAVVGAGLLVRWLMS